MKFGLILDESLFDDDFDFSDKSISDIFDDDFSDPEDSPVLEGPAEGTDTGVAGELIALINDEWEAIQGYNNAIATLRGVADQNPFYADAIKVLEDISAEENTHVGQLQEVLRRISPNAAEIDSGKKEAKNQLGLVGGILPVQSWDETRSEHTAEHSYNATDDICTLCDVDDEM